jgi:hypothetical protein
MSLIHLSPVIIHQHPRVGMQLLGFTLQPHWDGCISRQKGFFLAIVAFHEFS